MGKVFTVKNEYNDRVWTFEVGKTYYIVDRIAYTNNKGTHWLPSVEKVICIIAPAGEDEEFCLKHIEHVFWSPLSLGEYDHPLQYAPDDWDNIFVSSVEELNGVFLRRFAYDDEIKAIFFKELFDGVE